MSNVTMDRRLELHQILVDILGNEERVYFQPPANYEMRYPAIVYSRNMGASTYADNYRYNHLWRYSVTVVDSDPDSPYLDEMLKLPLCSFDRHFALDNLNHDVFNIYY